MQVQSIDLAKTAVEDARRVLQLIVHNDFNTRIPRAGNGLRWLRKHQHIASRSDDRYPVQLSATGRNLAIFWDIAHA